MLILQRKKGQSLIIGDNIRITIQDAGGDWVKLAIDAPRNLPILRSELIEAAEANKEALLPTGERTLKELSSLFNRQDRG